MDQTLSIVLNAIAVGGVTWLISGVRSIKTNMTQMHDDLLTLQHELGAHKDASAKVWTDNERHDVEADGRLTALERTLDRCPTCRAQSRL